MVRISVVAVAGLGGGAGAAVVGNNDPVAGFRQEGCHFPPRVPGLRRTVDEQHGSQGIRCGFDNGVADSDTSARSTQLRPRLVSVGSVSAGLGGLDKC